MNPSLNDEISPFLFESEGISMPSCSAPRSPLWKWPARPLWWDSWSLKNSRRPKNLHRVRLDPVPNHRLATGVGNHETPANTTMWGPQTIAFSWCITWCFIWFMVDITVVNGFINQLVTMGPHIVGFWADINCIPTGDSDFFHRHISEVIFQGLRGLLLQKHPHRLGWCMP